MTDPRNSRRTLEGVVTSDKMQKTITVLVTRTYKHAKYKKFVREHTKHHAHDEQALAKLGDRVEIMSCRPLSKLKRWTLVRVIEKATVITPLELLATEGGGA